MGLKVEHNCIESNVTVTCQLNEAGRKHTGVGDTTFMTHDNTMQMYGDDFASMVREMYLLFEGAGVYGKKEE